MEQNIRAIFNVERVHIMRCGVKNPVVRQFVSTGITINFVPTQFWTLAFGGYNEN